MKKIITISLFVIAIVLLVVSCPDKQDHINALKEVVTSVINDEASSLINTDDEGNSNAWANVSSIVGSLLGSTVVTAILENNISVANYFVCSVGKMTYEGEVKNISFGILGHVFTIDKKDIINFIHDNE